MKGFEHLSEYIHEYVKNDGSSTKPGHLPRLVIYFRMAFDKLGMHDGYVPEFFDWPDDIAEDFGTWGHNSRWNHTFSMMLYDNLDDYVDRLKSAMVDGEVYDFEVNYDE